MWRLWFNASGGICESFSLCMFLGCFTWRLVAFLNVSIVCSLLAAGLTSLTSFRSKRGDGEHSHISSSKVSSASIPVTPRSQEEILHCSNLKHFSFNELRMATRNFRPDSVVGEGGFGSVFKGWIDEHSLTPTKAGTGLVIAVKRLNREGLQGHKEWLVRIEFSSFPWLRFPVFFGS